MKARGSPISICRRALRHAFTKLICVYAAAGVSGTAWYQAAACSATAAYPDDAQLPKPLIPGMSAAQAGVCHAFFYSSWDCSFSPQRHETFRGWKGNHPPVLNCRTATKTSKLNFLLPRREGMLNGTRNAARRMRRVSMTPRPFPQAEKSPPGGWAGYARRRSNQLLCIPSPTEAENRIPG